MYTTWRLPELKEELRKRGASLRGKKRTWQYLNFTTKKLDQALHLYESRFLTVVRSSWTEDSCFIKGFCKKTMKNLQYEVNIKLNKEGPPEESHCECPAGSGVNATCKHIAVLLYAVENMAQQKCIILSEVCTQQLQKWNCPSKKYTGTPIKADKLPRKRSVKRLLFAPYPVENIDRESYNYKVRNLVLAFPNSTMPMKQCYEPANPYAVEADHQYLNMDARRNLLNELKLVDITDADIKNIQEATINQTESKEWHLQRFSKERPYLAASPDGLLGSQTLIEVKCPYASRFKNITPNTVPYLFKENSDLQLKTNSPYYYQIQGQLYCTGRDFCNLIVYTFKDLKVIFVSRNDAFIVNMLMNLDSFYENYFKEVIFNKYLYYNYERIE
ncbi:unnamed protein product [Euphydryas editha]|uniref:SWIM-type domain-containing protein n=1 Tax=Euphydryas editha TaxID=104508 RepID=A0AAU9TC66_EUPED|nr:unnamed protein product [Euphydryas editha]